MTCSDCMHFDVCEALETNGIKKVCPTQCGCFKNKANVIELPFLPGDDLYWIDEDDNTIRCQKHGIQAVVYRGNGKFAIVDDGSIEQIGTRWAQLTYEDAEKFIAEGGCNGCP